MNGNTEPAQSSAPLARARVSGTCGACRHAEYKRGAGGAELGFVACRYGNAWDWRNPEARCTFDPSRFER